MAANDKAPLGDGALPELITAVAGNANAVTAAQYTTFATLDIPQHLCHRLLTWLRCHACQRGYFAAGAPSPQTCPVCTGGRLQLVGLWDLAHETAPASMLVHPVTQEGQR